MTPGKPSIIGWLRGRLTVAAPTGTARQRRGRLGQIDVRAVLGALGCQPEKCPPGH